jgi:Spy/CpxP family protein refolding chaperone
MKTTALATLSLALAVLATPALAQDKAASPLASAELRSKILNDKKGLVAKNLNLTDAEAAKFWPVYEKFQKAVAGPRARMNRAVLDYVNSEANITEGNAKRLTNEVVKAHLDEAKLFSDHVARVQKVLTARKAARYMQIENKIRAIAEYEVASVIPLIP